MSPSPDKTNPLPPSLRQNYVPGHEVTENYFRGMQALGENDLEKALQILQSEPEKSPCHGLALGNSSLILNQLGRFADAEKRLKEANTNFKKNGCPHPPSWVQFTRNFGESISGQGRRVEAIDIFTDAERLAADLVKRFPAFKAAIELELAHSLNSCGGTLIHLQRFKAAADCLRRARDIYRLYDTPDKVGHAEVLTNYAVALTQINQKNDASIALSEAVQIASAGGDKGQLRRVQIATIQLDPSLLEGDPYQILGEASDEAISEGRLSTGYVRLCILASVALDRNDFQVAIDAVNKAKSLESQLDPSDPSPAQIRLQLAQALDKSGDSSSNVLQPLFEGARLWFTRLSMKQVSGDFHTATRFMHDHFRYLARKLLDEGRNSEALVAFEFGRGVGYATEIDPSALGAILALNPFKQNLLAVNCEYLVAAQATLENDEVVLVTAILPPEIVAFIVHGSGVEVVSAPLPEADEDCQALFRDIRLIPSRLKERVGIRAFPELIQDIAKRMAAAIDKRSVLAILPNSFLHQVPWRALLRSCGIPWKKLSCTTGFGMLARTPKCSFVIRKCCALGYGSVGEIDLNKEAQDFATAFGDGGQFVKDCEARDILTALGRHQAVLLSCHGDLGGNAEGAGVTVIFQVSGGGRSVEEILPERIASDLVILSACNSGVYEVVWSDYPIGAAPEILRRGGRYCIATRFPVNARYSAKLMKCLSQGLSSAQNVVTAFAEALEEMEGTGADFWKDIACFELLGRD